MKKTFLALSAATIILGMSSCEKVKDKVFPSFETSGGTVLVKIPVIPVTSVELETEGTTIPFNLDSTIKANTGGNFSLSNASSVQLSSVELTVLNGDGENNISNFETAKISISSNSNPTSVVVASATLADANQPAVINGNGAELKSYLQGNQITYKVSGKARRTTSKDLQTSINLVFKIS